MWRISSSRAQEFGDLLLVVVAMDVAAGDDPQPAQKIVRFGASETDLAADQMRDQQLEVVRDFRPGETIAPWKRVGETIKHTGDDRVGDGASDIEKSRRA